MELIVISNAFYQMRFVVRDLKKLNAWSLTGAKDRFVQKPPVMYLKTVLERALIFVVQNFHFWGRKSNVPPHVQEPAERQSCVTMTQIVLKEKPVRPVKHQALMGSRCVLRNVLIKCRLAPLRRDPSLLPLFVTN